MSRRPDQSSAPVRPDQSSVRPAQPAAQAAQQSRAPVSSASQQSRPAPPAAAAAFDPRQAIQQQQRPPQPQQQRPPQQQYTQIDDRVRKMVPSERVMMEATVIALQKDKPIILTFWHDSIVRNVYVANNVRENETIIEKVKERPDDELECTSRIMKEYRNENGNRNGIFETENSIYIVVPDIPTRNV